MIQENLALNVGIILGITIGQLMGIDVPSSVALVLMGALNAYFFVHKFIEMRVKDE